MVWWVSGHHPDDLMTTTFVSDTFQLTAVIPATVLANSSST